MYQIDKKKVVIAYRNADENGKKILKDLLGIEIEDVPVTDRVKSYEDACTELGIENPTLLGMLPQDAKSIIAYAKLIIIARALNEGWEPDWNNSRQYKYYPFFIKNSAAGSGFSFHDIGYDRAYTNLGSRLVYKTRDLATFAAKQFIDLYNDFLTL